MRRSAKVKTDPRICFDSSAAAWLNITELNMRVWSEAYPACNIGYELKKMVAWLMANPKKAPRKNYARFITNWLSTAQDRGGSRIGQVDKVGDELRGWAERDKS